MIDDLVSGDDVFFAATGISDGELLQGVRYWGDGASTQSLVMRSKSGTIRIIDATAPLDEADVVLGGALGELSVAVAALGAATNDRVDPDRGERREHRVDRDAVALHRERDRDGERHDRREHEIRPDRIPAPPQRDEADDRRPRRTGRTRRARRAPARARAPRSDRRDAAFCHGRNTFQMRPIRAATTSTNCCLCARM